MDLTIILLDIFFVLTCLVFLILLKIKCLKNSKNSNFLIDFISRSSIILEKYEKDQETIQLRNSIKLYSLIRIIINAAKPSYVSFFKYSYNQDKEYKMNFIFSVDSDGIALQFSCFEKNAISSDLLKITKSKNIDYEISHLYITDIKDDNDNLYQALLNMNVEKLYLKHVYNSNNSPIGLIILAYNNKNHTLSECDKSDLFKILEEIKHFI